jgi:hypothetical protein
MFIKINFHFVVTAIQRRLMNNFKKILKQKQISAKKVELSSQIEALKLSYVTSTFKSSNQAP